MVSWQNTMTVFPYRGFDSRYDCSTCGQEMLIWMRNSRRDMDKVWTLSTVSPEICDSGEHGGKPKDIILYLCCQLTFTLRP